MCGCTSGSTSNFFSFTGLGSPLTYNFGTSLEISPTSGPANGSMTLNGLGFTTGGSVNISYLNPLTSAWTPVVSNLTIASANFTYTITAPDLGQNNTAGDNQALSDNIIFRAQDNSSNKSYNSTVPYTEMRRGLNQISNITSAGFLGTARIWLQPSFYKMAKQSRFRGTGLVLERNYTVGWKHKFGHSRD